MRNARATIFLPLSQEDWRDAVRSFVANENLEIFTAEVCITAGDDRVIATDHWRSGDRNATDIADGITEWVELRRDGESAEDLEVAISIWDEQAVEPSRLDEAAGSEVKRQLLRRGLRKIG